MYILRLHPQWWDTGYHWLHSGYVLIMLLYLTLLLEPRNCVFSIVPLDCFAVIDTTSKNLANSRSLRIRAGSPFDCCTQRRQPNSPQNLLPGNLLVQEPITRSLHLPHKPYETTFARIFLFLETAWL